MEQSSVSSEVRRRALAVATFLDDAGAGNVVTLDVGGKSAFTDFFVIATANSDGHMRGLVRRCHESLDELDLHPRQSVKRSDESGWTLLDCGDVIIHIMLPAQREFYELEKLWFDADRL